MARPEKAEGADELLVTLKSLTSEIQSVKGLLMLQALASGCQQKHIAAVLGVSDATVSRMFPKGFAKEMAEVSNRRASGMSEEP